MKIMPHMTGFHEERLQNLHESFRGNIRVYSRFMKVQETPNTIEPDRHT